MKLQQLRYLCEIARRDLSFSSAADALDTSQPGISKQMRLLEQELGVDLLVRSGNRISALTEPGVHIVEIATHVLREVDSIRSAAHEFTQGDAGPLNIAATFTLSRYVLPRVLQGFVARYPGVDVKLLHGTSNEICRMVVAGEAGIALTTDPTN